MNNINIKVIVLLMVLAAFCRFIPHMPNFTPTEGLTLLGAAYLGRKQWAIFIPIIMLYFSDLIINNTIARPYFPNQEGIIWFAPYMIFNLIAIIAIVMICSGILKKINFLSVFGSALMASILFFLITNFGSWIDGFMPYSKNLSGLMACYVAAIPFFWTSLISNLVFTGVLFGSYELFKSIEYKRNGVESQA